MFSMRSDSSLLDQRFVSQLLKLSHLLGGVADRIVTASGPARRHRPVHARTQGGAALMICRILKAVTSINVRQISSACGASLIVGPRVELNTHASNLLS